MAAKLPLFKYFLVSYVLISFKNILLCSHFPEIRLVYYAPRRLWRLAVDAFGVEPSTPMAPRLYPPLKISVYATVFVYMHRFIVHSR